MDVHKLFLVACIAPTGECGLKYLQQASRKDLHYPFPYARFEPLQSKLRVCNYTEILFSPQPCDVRSVCPNLFCYLRDCLNWRGYVRIILLHASILGGKDSPRRTTRAEKKKTARISSVGPYIKPLSVQCAPCYSC